MIAEWSQSAFYSFACCVTASSRSSDCASVCCTAVRPFLARLGLEPMHRNVRSWWKLT
jgi:hypothetical protein